MRELVNNALQKLNTCKGAGSEEAVLYDFAKEVLRWDRAQATPSRDLLFASVTARLVDTYGTEEYMAEKVLKVVNAIEDMRDRNEAARICRIAELTTPKQRG